MYYNHNDRQQANKKNFRRSQGDYVWIMCFFAVLFLLGEYFYPERTPPEERKKILGAMNPLEFENTSAILLTYGIGGSLGLSWVLFLQWTFMKWWAPQTPTTHLYSQLKAISVNMLLLPFGQGVFDYISTLGAFKQTTGRTDPTSLVTDGLLWVLMFELTWYAQHRLMHDNKLLWSLGHQYHHGWKRPEHMIGLTNYAFDHVVEVWVTMSSANVGMYFFPINFYYAKALGFAYAVLAVFVHWDAFATRYHLNHHYLVTKNYGSHVPIFDMFFGTYHWDEFVHRDTLKAMKAASDGKTG